MSLLAIATKDRPARRIDGGTTTVTIPGACRLFSDMPTAATPARAERAPAVQDALPQHNADRRGKYARSDEWCERQSAAIIAHYADHVAAICDALWRYISTYHDKHGRLPPERKLTAHFDLSRGAISIYKQRLAEQGALRWYVTPGGTRRYVLERRHGE